MSFLKTIFRKKNDPIRGYGDFWTWFQSNEKAFFAVIKKTGDIERDFFGKIAPKLSEIKDGFFFLTGMFDETTAELILTPDGVVKNVVFVEELVDSAPKIPGWKFTSLKPAVDIQNVRIDMNGYVFAADTLSFYAREHRDYPDEIDIVVVHKHHDERDRDNILNGVYLFLDNFLGELEMITAVDNLSVVGSKEAEKDPIPMEKLKAFLVWRQKEFVEKYEGERHDTENDAYVGFEGELQDSGRKLIATINKTLLEWDRKASHPWLMLVRIGFRGDENSGMPDDETFDKMENFENEIMGKLKDVDGYLNIGRETGDDERTIYFACKDFRKPSKVLHELTGKFRNVLEVSYDIFKDKYWRRMERYG